MSGRHSAVSCETAIFLAESVIGLLDFQANYIKLRFGLRASFLQTAKNVLPSRDGRFHRRIPCLQFGGVSVHDALLHGVRNLVNCITQS